jgi:hypothetical protein
MEHWHCENHCRSDFELIDGALHCVKCGGLAVAALDCWCVKPIPPTEPTQRIETKPELLVLQTRLERKQAHRLSTQYIGKTLFVESIAVDRTDNPETALVTFNLTMPSRSN